MNRISEPDVDDLLVIARMVGKPAPSPEAITEAEIASERIAEMIRGGKAMPAHRQILQQLQVRLAQLRDAKKGLGPQANIES